MGEMHEIDAAVEVAREQLRPADTPMVPEDRDLIERLDAQNWRGVTSTMFRLTQAQAEKLKAALSASPVGEGASASPIPTEQAGGAVVGWRPIETAPRVREIGHLWLAADANGKVFPGVFVGHRIPADAAKVLHIPDPSAPSTTSTAEQVGERDDDTDGPGSVGGGQLSEVF